jgi:hypothetical protein
MAILVQEIQHIFASHALTLQGRNYLSDLKTQFINTLASVIKPDKLVHYREITAVCYEIHLKHINALRAERRISEC